MYVSVMLCDFAELVNGKLYISGGEWSISAAGRPVNLAIAVVVRCEWTETNRPHKIKISVHDADGKSIQIDTPDGKEDLNIEGQIEIGRPPGSTPGQMQHSPFAFTINQAVLPAAQYRIEVEVNGSVEAFTTFELKEPG